MEMEMEMEMEREVAGIATKLESSVGLKRKGHITDNLLVEFGDVDRDGGMVAVGIKGARMMFELMEKIKDGTIKLPETEEEGSSIKPNPVAGLLKERAKLLKKRAKMRAKLLMKAKMVKYRIAEEGEVTDDE